MSSSRIGPVSGGEPAGWPRLNTVSVSRRSPHGSTRALTLCVVLSLLRTSSVCPRTPPCTRGRYMQFDLIDHHRLRRHPARNRARLDAGQRVLQRPARSHQHCLRAHLLGGAHAVGCRAEGPASPAACRSASPCRRSYQSARAAARRPSRAGREPGPGRSRSPRGAPPRPRSRTGSSCRPARRRPGEPRSGSGRRPTACLSRGKAPSMSRCCYHVLDPAPGDSGRCDKLPLARPGCARALRRRFIAQG